MEVYNPKPAHNLCEFLVEVAVVAVGIVIPLAAETAVIGELKKAVPQM